MLAAPAVLTSSYQRVNEHQIVHRPDAVDILIVIVKAILITAAILYFGKFVGLNVREAGGHAVAVSLSASETQAT